MSYARKDDEYNHGAIIELKEQIIREVRILTGDAEFDIYVDFQRLGWGTNWRSELNSGLTESQFIIPVFSPIFLRRPECRSEVLRFLELEKARGRDDLILPIYYVEVAEMDPHFRGPIGEEERQVVEAIRSHQYIDWRDLRNRDLKEGVVWQNVTALAKRLTAAIKRTMPRPESAVQHDRGSVVFDSNSDEFHTDLASAVAEAGAGGRVVVKPGVHQVAGFDVATPVVIAGDDPDPSKCVLRLAVGTCFRWTASGGGMNGVRLECAQGQPALQAKSSKVVLTRCTVVGSGADVIEVGANAGLALKSCRLQGGRHGIIAIEPSKVEVSDSEITGAAMSGIRTWCTSLTIRDTRISGNNEGVWVGHETKGSFDRCDLTGNKSGVGTIMPGANVEFRDTKGADLLHRLSG